MKRKILLFIFGVFLFLFIPKVNALTITPEQLVTRVKQIEFYKLVNSVDGFSWQINYDSESKEITNLYTGIDENEEKFEITVDLEYSETEKSLYFESSAANNEEQMEEMKILGLIISEIGDMFGYDNNAVKTLLEGDEILGYDFDTDGIALEREVDGESFLVSELKISLADGFGHLEPLGDSNVDENPTTTKPVTTTTKNVTTTTTQPTSTAIATTEKPATNPKTNDLDISIYILGLLSCIGMIFVAMKKTSKNI